MRRNVATKKDEPTKTNANANPTRPGGKTEEDPNVKLERELIAMLEMREGVFTPGKLLNVEPD
jgi:hypothetical protein